MLRSAFPIERPSDELSVEPCSGPIIEIADLTRIFGSGTEVVVAIDKVSLSIAEGEFVAIVGASGSGKSTLMNILGCLDRPTHGRYAVFGRETKDLDPDELAELRREYFGFVFQRYHLLGDLNAIDNVEMPAIYASRDKKTRRQRAGMLLGRLGMADRTNHRPGQLSGGQQQRVSIARALMNGGKIILADEPTGALDTRSGEEVMRLLQELHVDGHTVIIITHDTGVARHAGRIIELRDGRIVSDQQPDNITASSVTAKQTITSGRKAFAPFFTRMQEALPMAWRAMAAHPLRTLLTMLGIIIGVAAVVAVVALGEGSRQRVLAEISSLGTNTVSIYPGKGWGDDRATMIDTLVPADAEALAKQSYVDSVTPELSLSDTVVAGQVSAIATVNGVGENYFRVNGIPISRGTSFDSSGVHDGLQVAVIDRNARNTLFPDGTDPIGRTILVRQTLVRVVGIAGARPGNYWGAQRSVELYLPYTTMLRRLTGPTHLSGIRVRMSDAVSSKAAEAAVVKLLTLNHGRKDFFIENSDTIRGAAERTTNTLTLLISSVAAISLLVGGIGVMNIMLVSIVERRREIGLRIAIGARQIDILFQFLIEATAICVLGAVAGLALAILMGLIVNRTDVGFRMVFSTDSMAVACAVAIGIGLVFGYLPARNAARLDPVDALERD